jgi:hypothetical protein
MNVLKWADLIRTFLPVLTEAWPHIKALLELFNSKIPASTQPQFATAGAEGTAAAQRGASDLGGEREELVKLITQAGEDENTARKLVAKL